MTRGRAQLTDKEQRILVQAQLMGLSTANMVKIGNRLKAVEKEQETRQWVDEQCRDYTWDTPANRDLLKVTLSDGTAVQAVKGVKGNNHWAAFSWKYTITVTAPGQKSKPKVYHDRELVCNYEWLKRLMPAQSKELFSLIRWCRYKMHYER